MQTLRDILTFKRSGTRTILSDASLQDAAEVLSAQRIGALPVVSKGRLTGIITARHVLRQVAKRRNLTAISVADVMNRNIPSALETDTLDHAVVLLKQFRTRHLFVLRDGDILGVVSVSDLLTAMRGEPRYGAVIGPSPEAWPFA